MGYTQFGIWLARVMEDRGIASQSELGRRLGVSHATVNRWMSGVTRPDYDQVEDLARVLEVSRQEVYQALGVLPKSDDPRLARVLEVWQEATAEEKDTVADIARRVIRGHSSDSSEPSRREADR